MRPLPPFWHAAARLTGRLDLSGLVQAGIADASRLPAAHLVAHGVRFEHATALAAGAGAGPRADWLCLADAGYPVALRPLPHAPPVLFLQGDPGLLSASAVAIVGSRRCTGDGQRMARRMARAVVDAGGVVVSGLAQGIDCAAHGACPGRTIAVLGQGLGRSLPAPRERLRQEILDAGGLVLSELLPSTAAARHTYPMRNRIIAGLARATVVVEARVRSGARITARCALEAGREVLAVPGHPLQDTAGGCLALLREGAGLVVEPADLLAAAGLEAPAAVPPPADPLLAALVDGPCFDALLARTGRPARELLRDLGRLQLAGRVRQLPGDRYALAGAPGQAGAGARPG